MFSPLIDWSTSGRGCMGERRDAAECVKRRLEELRKVEKRIEAFQHEFAQLAVASRLKSEFDPTVCESERRCPVTCFVRSRQLTHGRLLLLELTNRLPGVSLTDWTVVIQTLPLFPLDISRQQPPGQGFNRVCTYANPLPRLDPGCTVNIDFYCQQDTSSESVSVTRPFMVRCYLARQFSDPINGSKRVVTCCVSTNILAANDLVSGRSSFSLHQQRNLISLRNEEIDTKQFRFSITGSLLVLFFQNQTDLRRRFMEWLFPQVEQWEWPDRMKKRLQQQMKNQATNSSVNVLRSPVLLLSTSATVKCSIQEKIDDYLVAVELSAPVNDAARLLNHLKSAILMKIMLALSQLRKYPVDVRLDHFAISGKKESISKAEFDDYFRVKFPFA